MRDSRQARRVHRCLVLQDAKRRHTSKHTLKMLSLRFSIRVRAATAAWLLSTSLMSNPEPCRSHDSITTSSVFSVRLLEVFAMGCAQSSPQRRREEVVSPTGAIPPGKACLRVQSSLHLALARACVRTRIHTHTHTHTHLFLWVRCGRNPRGVGKQRRAQAHRDVTGVHLVHITSTVCVRVRM